MDIIIGAGITGLCYAMFSSGDYTIVEKEPEIGGYCRTIKRNGYVWDYSGHFFHFQNPTIKELIMESMDSDSILSILKETHIKYKDILVDFPFQKNIHQLSKEELIDCLYDLFTIENKNFDTFQEMLYCKFGKSIAEKFLIPYNEKLYACDLNTLDKNAMGRFFPYADKEDIIRNFRKAENKSYNGTFVYPKGGAVEYINSVYSHIDANKVRLNSIVKNVSLKDHCLTLNDGTKFHYDRLISTIPITELMNISGIKYDKSKYTWNQVLCFNLGFDKKGKNTTDHWLYFPEKKYCFYRVGFYDNILNQDKMSLYVELGFSKDVEVKPKDWMEQIIKDLKKAGIVDENQKLLDYESVVMNPAYVHVNNHTLTDITAKKAYLSKYDVYSIGRYGSWTYCSIEDNIKEAQSLALQLHR